ncbi:MAG: tetratricopeptide repeat protein [Pseudomonadota bacterium]
MLSSELQADERLNLLKNISAAGAPALTLRMLDQAQPKVDQDLYQWILWEQERYSILTQWRQWDELLVRIENLPIDIPDQFRAQAATFKARAYLELEQPVSAREILRQQLWQDQASNYPDYETWRQLIIISYLKEDRVDDARIAMVRFEQDFENDELAWLLLRARVLIDSNRHEQAIQMLEGNDAWEARAVRLFARFELNPLEFAEIWRSVNKQVKAEGTTPDERASLWALGFYAAGNMSPVDQVVALESLFRNGVISPLEIFHVPVDELWQAYLNYAELVGNRAELLQGDDVKWLELADKAATITPVKARSLYAKLMLESNDIEISDQAANGYMKTFAEVDESERHLLESLFNKSEVYSNARNIPAGIRYQLVDLALKSADIEKATRLMSGLTTVPEGANKLDWQLRQSRVLVLGGRYDEGNQVLESLITDYQEPETGKTDRILQVLFDLQTVDLHRQAITHFNQLLNLEIDPGQRREILFWIGDSYRGLEKYEQAALLYLQSAMLPASNSMDPWAQTARFNAAESLQLAGLTDDARRIYQELLSITDDAGRRSVLSHKIQQLWLNQRAIDSVDG